MIIMGQQVNLRLTRPIQLQQISDQLLSMHKSKEALEQCIAKHKPKFDEWVIFIKAQSENPNPSANLEAWKVQHEEDRKIINELEDTLQQINARIATLEVERSLLSPPISNSSLIFQNLQASNNSLHIDTAFDPPM